MTDNINVSQPFDPRIIQTVRKLKEDNPKEQNPNNSDNSDKTSGDSSHSNEEKTESKKTHEHISQKNLNRISIDGSIDKRNSLRENSEKLPINQKSLLSTTGKITIESRYKNPPGTANGGTNKARANFLKNLMNDASMKKYKASCIAILKDDNEIKKLCEECGIANTNFSMENFIEKNFFSNQVFLYKLEMLLGGDQIINKNYKEKFFRKEIYKILYQKSIDIKYQNKAELLAQTFDHHFDLIANFNFSKD